jgi:hypothetical protein
LRTVFAWICLDLLGFAWICLDLLGFVVLFTFYRLHRVRRVRQHVLWREKDRNIQSIVIFKAIVHLIPSFLPFIPSFLPLISRVFMMSI